MVTQSTEGGSTRCAVDVNPLRVTIVGLEWNAAAAVCGYSGPMTEPVAALRVPANERGRVRVPLSGTLGNTLCVRCGGRATLSRSLLVDGRYRYRPLLAALGVLSAWSGPALAVIVPMLTFMRRVSRHHARLDVRMCSACDDWLARRARRSRTLEAAASLLPLAGVGVGAVSIGGLAGIILGPLAGAAGTLLAVVAIERRRPQDRARLVGADAQGWILDVPASWKDAVESDPDPSAAGVFEQP